MTRSKWILLFALALPIPGGAFADPPATVELEAGSDPERLADDLDRALRNALDEGLLSPRGLNDPAPALRGSSGDDESIPVPMARMPGCSGMDPFDFSDVADIDSYQKLQSLVDWARAQPDSDFNAVALRVARAHIVLGLTAESRGLLEMLPAVEADPLRGLAHLLDGHNQLDLAYFRDQADCHESAGIWLATALLVSDAPGAHTMLDEEMLGYRRLPLPLRKTIAGLALPVLAARNQHLIAQKLLAGFSESDLADNRALNFGQSLLDLSRGRPGAEERVRAFAVEPQLRDQAIAALLRNQRPVSDAQVDILMDDLLTAFRNSDGDAVVTPGTSYALARLSAGARYSELLALAEQPMAAIGPLHEEIQHYIIAGLRADLDSDDRLRNLAALDVLAGTPAILEGRAERESLYQSGAVLALRYGFGSLGDSLSNETTPNAALAQTRAERAYWRKDYASVYALATAFPQDETLNQLATQSALKSRDGLLAEVFANRLPARAAIIVPILELDAAEEAWLLPNGLYRMAENFSAIDMQDRVDRVLALKRDADGTGQVPAPISIAQIPDLISRPVAEPTRLTGGSR